MENVNYLTQSISAEIQGILRHSKEPGDALIRLIYYFSSLDHRLSIRSDDARVRDVAKYFNELCESCLVELGGEEIPGCESEWENRTLFDKWLCISTLAACASILVRYGKSQTRIAEWLNYINGRLEKLG